MLYRPSVGEKPICHYHSVSLVDSFPGTKSKVNMKSIFVVCVCLFSLMVVSPASAQTGSGPRASKELALPYIPSLDVSAMDKSVDPCVDLYHYSCGGWQKKNPIPPDQTSWSVYGKLYQDNLLFLRGILEQAGPSAPQRDAVTQKIGDFYASCMDEATADKRGAGAIQPQLDAIAALKSAHDMAPLVARLPSSLWPHDSVCRWVNPGSGQLRSW